MSTMIRSMIHSLEACIHERLAVLEEVVRGSAQEVAVDKSSSAAVGHEDILAKLGDIEQRLRRLELTGATVIKTETAVVEPVPAVVKKETMWIDAMKDLEIILPTPISALPSIVVAEPTIAEEVEEVEVKVEVEEEEAVEEEVEEEEVEVEEEEVEVEEEEVEEEEVEEEEVAEEEEEEVEEAVEEEAVEEEEEEVAEEEEEAEELEEIVFKGKTYLKDSDNNIYNANDDEIGDPIGVWDVARARVLFKRIA